MATCRVSDLHEQRSSWGASGSAAPHVPTSRLHKKDEQGLGKMLELFWISKQHDFFEISQVTEAGCLVRYCILEALPDSSNHVNDARTVWPQDCKLDVELPRTSRNPIRES